MADSKEAPDDVQALGPKRSWEPWRTGIRLVVVARRSHDVDDERSALENVHRFENRDEGRLTLNGPRRETLHSGLHRGCGAAGTSDLRSPCARSTNSARCSRRKDLPFHASLRALSSMAMACSSGEPSELRIPAERTSNQQTVIAIGSDEVSVSGRRSPKRRHGRVLRGVAVLELDVEIPTGPDTRPFPQPAPWRPAWARRRRNDVVASDRDAAIGPAGQASTIPAGTNVGTVFGEREGQLVAIPRDCRGLPSARPRQESIPTHAEPLISRSSGAGTETPLGRVDCASPLATLRHPGRRVQGQRRSRRHRTKTGDGVAWLARSYGHWVSSRASRSRQAATELVPRQLLCAAPPDDLLLDSVTGTGPRP